VTNNDNEAIVKKFPGSGEHHCRINVHAVFSLPDFHFV
jgi:hypothetical protein